MITLTAFEWVPEPRQGFVKDLRVRWALEEAGLAYKEELIGLKEKLSARYRNRQPFAQVPVLETDEVKLFESGAIVLHVAENSEVLMPRDVYGRARTKVWMFAALNSVEPPLEYFADIEFFSSGDQWTGPQRDAAEDAVHGKLVALEHWLGTKDYLESQFSAGDLLMTTVLRNLRTSELLSKYAAVAAYRQRCEARPAFKKAMEDHLRPFGIARRSAAVGSGSVPNV